MVNFFKNSKNGHSRLLDSTQNLTLGTYTPIFHFTLFTIWAHYIMLDFWKWRLLDLQFLDLQVRYFLLFCLGKEQKSFIDFYVPFFLLKKFWVIYYPKKHTHNTVCTVVHLVWATSTKDRDLIYIIQQEYKPNLQYKSIMHLSKSISSPLDL